MRAWVLGSILLAVGCTGPSGPAGADGSNGSDGLPGSDGTMGTPGSPGADALTAWNTAPGIDVEIVSLAVGATAATVTFTLDDTPGAGGAPLDRSGRLTDGTIGVRFALAQLASVGTVAGGYDAYTTKTVGAATQPATESVDANFEAVDLATGTYRYTIAAPLTGFDPTKTQTVVAVASRTLEGVTGIDRAVHSVRPDGGAMLTRAVASTSQCASCHGSVSAHEERFDAVEQCVLCHSDGTSDPATQNSLDLRVMIHKIHRGAGLPSVVSGGTYSLEDSDGGVHDYATVAYPQPIARCDSCHGGAESDAWHTNPSIAACTSCHDDVSFAAVAPPNMVAHIGSPITDETTCIVCHRAGSIAPVLDRHVDPSIDYTQDLALEIVSIQNTSPGQMPTFRFRVTVNGAPRDLTVSPVSFIRAILAGPNGDFTQTWTGGSFAASYATATVMGSGATGSLVPVDAANGVFDYTFPVSVPIPLTAVGNFTLGLEGRINGAIPYSIATSVTRDFVVTGVAAMPRRTIVDEAKCESCHYEVTHHATSRGVATCVLCHNPANVDDRVSRLESSTVLAESVDFRVMIHRVHAGTMLTQPYSLGRIAPTTLNPSGSMVDFSETRYPRSPAECGACHLPGTEALPTSGGGASIRMLELTCLEDPSFDPDSYCTGGDWSVSQSFALAPETAACTGCHDAPYVVAHGELNTTASGVEACATCHGPGRSFDVDLVHPH